MRTKVVDHFGPLRKMGPGACRTQEIDGGRWYVTRGTHRTWHLLFRIDRIWHQFGTFATRKAAISAYERMEV